MRRLMWVSIGLAAACALGAYCGLTAVCILAVISLIGAVALIPHFRKKGMRLAVGLMVGLILGSALFAGYHAWYLQPALRADGTTVSLTAEITDYSYETGYGIAAEGRFFLDGKRYNVKLYLNEKRQLIPGDVVRGDFRLRYTAGGKEDPTYHRGDGIFLLCYPKSETVIIETQQIPDRHYPAVLRHRILATIDKTFPADTAFFAKALLLGDKSDMDHTVSTAFKVSGISHIVAVSGLHVSMLFAILTLISGKRRLLTAIIVIPVLLLFAAVAGFTPSVTRACLMQALMIIGGLFNKEYDPPTSLAFAVTVMLVVNPMVITSVSFQLSVGCMAGIFLFSKRISNWISSLSFWSEWKGKTVRTRFRGWVAGGAGITLSAMFFTTPLVAYYFGAVSLIGVLTNLLTLWAVALAFNGIMVVCLVYSVFAEAAMVIVWCVSWLIRYVIEVAKMLAAVPMAAVYTQSVYIVLWLVLCYGLIAVFLFVKNRRPLVLICCAVSALCLALCMSWVEPVLDDTRMTVLDVGQGQCIILQGNGRTFVVDCGGDSDIEAADLAAETLLSQGISRLDGVIVTHYDRDHAGGVGYLLSRIPADTVFLPDSPDEDDMLETILPYCDGKERFVNEDLLLRWEDNDMTIFAPILSSSDNERGLCVLFRDEKCDILITGDLSSLGEKLLLTEKRIPELTVLVAGHHGSSRSTGQALLDATRPRYVFISVGADNYYGHPGKAVLDRLNAAGCRICRTDQNGTIIFRR